MRAIGTIVLTALAVGCAAQPQLTTAPMLSTPPGVTQFQSAKAGFALGYPPDWKAVQKDRTLVLTLVPKLSAGSDDDPTIAIDEPVLPPHIPGLIPLGSVDSGFVDDLKNQHSDTKIDARSGMKLDGVGAWRIVSSFQNEGKPWRQVALLVVHGDHVYVITGDSNAKEFEKTSAAFDTVMASWKWIGR